jgi:hypothetical protein
MSYLFFELFSGRRRSCGLQNAIFYDIFLLELRVLKFCLINFVSRQEVTHNLGHDKVLKIRKMCKIMTL